MLAAAGTASAADIEGTWSFGDGQVTVVRNADGTFTGTVIKPTSFSGCAHPVGQRMWTDIRQQPDGEYFGRHVWFASGSCSPGASGLTAWRVLKRADGSTFLRACFSGPEFAAAQPTIAADGTHANTQALPPYDAQPCSDSTFIAPPAKPTFQNTVVLPSQGKRTCLSRRSFRIRLRQPKGDPLVSATVKVNGKRVKVVQGARLTAPVDLRGLPKGRYTVSITAVTTTGRTIAGSRRYRTCVPKRHR